MTKPCGGGLEIQRRQHDRGIDDAGLQRGEACGRDARRNGVVVALLEPVRRHHLLEIDGGDVVVGADRDDLALEIGDRLQAGLADQHIGRGVADHADQRQRRALVDGADRVGDADAERHVERAAGELLGDRRAALREVQFEIQALGGEETLVHGNVDGPQRRLAAERAGDHLVGRLRGWPNQKQSAAESSANCVHQRFPERAVCFLAIGEPRSQFADGFRIHRGDCVAAANLTDLNWDRGRGRRRWR